MAVRRNHTDFLVVVVEEHRIGSWGLLLVFHLSLLPFVVWVEVAEDPVAKQSVQNSRCPEKVPETAQEDVVAPVVVAALKMADECLGPAVVT